MKAAYSLRRRLSLGLLAGLLASGTLVGGGLYLYLAHVLTAAFDRTLLEQGRLLAARVDQEVTPAGPGPLEFEYAQGSRPEYAADAPPGSRVYFELIAPDGSVLARSDSLRGGAEALPARPVAVPPPGEVRYVLADVELPSDTDGRALTLRFRPDAEGRDDQGRTVITPDAPAGVATLVLAASREPLDRMLAGVLLGLTGGGVALALVAAAVAWLTLRRAMRPLDRWAAAVSQIDPALPDGPPVGRDAPRELRPVADKLDDLLRRVAETLARERRFTDDAAHELRTPLAEMRAAAEVALRRPALESASRQTFEDVAASAVHMGRLVEALLSLRRAGRCAANTEAADVAEVVRQAAGRASAGNGREWILDVPPCLCREVDAALLAAAVENLLGNAAAHAAGAGEVRVTLVGEPGQIVLCVSNPAEGLTPLFAERACEPFWRADAARGDEGHFGLGLTLVDECRRRAGGELEFAVEGARLHARLRWPAADVEN